MQRKQHIKPSFVGFPLVVTPLQNVFHKEGGEANLNTDVLQILSGLQNNLIGEMMDGACALSQNRRSDDVVAEDLLCHLDTQWKVDPLLMSGNFYRVEETTKKVDLSIPTEPLPRKRRKRRCSNQKKITPKVRKVSAKKLKEMNREAHKRTLDICRQMVFKLPMPLPLKKKSELFDLKKKTDLELKAERQTSDDIMSRPDIIEFFGNKHKRYSFDSVPKPSPVAPSCKSNYKVEKKTSICERMIKVHPSKKQTELEFKVPKRHPDSLTIGIHGMKQYVADAVTEQSPETSTYKPKSKVEEKMSTYDRSIKFFNCKERTEHELKVAKQPSIKMSSCQDNLLVRLPGIKLKQEVSGVDAVLKQYPEAPLCKPKSKVEKKLSTWERLIKVCPSKGKNELEFKVAKQPSVETQVFKIPGKKWKQELPSVNCASVESSEVERQPSIEISRLDSQAPKIPGKKRKQELFDINGVPVETPEAARKRLAIVLLRIAGRY